MVVLCSLRIHDVVSTNVIAQLREHRMGDARFLCAEAELGADGLRVEVPIDADEAQRREWLEGPVRGIELYNSGLLVLHGSCLRMGHCLLDLVGQSGAGKSTLASLLCLRGATLVSDGMTPLQPETLRVESGPPRTKLNDASLRLLGVEPSTYPLVHPESAKRYFPVRSVTEHFSDVPSSCSSDADVVVGPAESDTSTEQLRLGLILIVEDAEETEIVPIAGARALIELIKNVYLVEHFPPDHSPILMQRAAAVIQRGVQVKALRRKKVPERLFEIAEVIEREVSTRNSD